MSNEHHFAFLLALRQREKLRDKSKRHRKHKFWIRKIFRERLEKGEYYQLVLEMKLCDHELFFRYFRMLPRKFEELLTLIGPYLLKNCRNREPISPEERLSITLRYLATGDSHSMIAMSYRMSNTTVGRIIMETCKTIWSILLEHGFLKAPSTQQEWKEIAQMFEFKWNFPNCVGAIDGKHVVMQAPPRAGSTFFNYKGTHSIVLMAVVNSDYEFTIVDIGEAGRQSDGGVFANGHIGYAMNNDLLNLPPPRQISPNSNKRYPYVFTGDEAFPLKTYLVKPYPRSSIGIKERVANYRISRARRVVENAFGIAASRFRIFRRPIIARTELVVEITKAVVILHNFLMRGRTESRNKYFPAGYADEETSQGVRPGGWRAEEDNSGMIDISQLGSANYSKDAKQVRDDFRDYFFSEGSLAWQIDMVNSTQCNFDEQ